MLILLKYSLNYCEIDLFLFFEFKKCQKKQVMTKLPDISGSSKSYDNDSIHDIQLLNNTMMSHKELVFMKDCY